MTSNIIAFRPADGTNARELADVRDVLPPSHHANITRGGAPRIVIGGPGGWATIARRGGVFRGTLTMPDHLGLSGGATFDGHSNARDAAGEILDLWAQAELSGV